MLKRIILSVLCIFSIHGAAQKTVILDLGGVVFASSSWSYMRAMDFPYIVDYAFQDQKIPTEYISQAFQDQKIITMGRILDFISKLDFPVPDGFVRAHYIGRKIPLAICLYQAGLTTREKILARADEMIPQLREEGFFISEREERVLLNGLSTFCEPSVYVQANTPISETVQLLKELSEQYNNDGTRKYRLLGLSNWDGNSFPLIKQKYSQELSYFEDIIISADVNLLKPNPEIFKHVLTTYNLEPKDCIFVDDQQENVDAARELGIESFLFTSASELRRAYDFVSLESTGNIT